MNTASLVSPRLTITSKNILSKLPQTKEQLTRFFCGKQEKLAAKLESRLSRLVAQKKIVLIGAFYYGINDPKAQAPVSQPDQPEQVPSGPDGILPNLPSGEPAAETPAN